MEGDFCSTKKEKRTLSKLSKSSISVILSGFNPLAVYIRIRAFHAQYKLDLEVLNKMAVSDYFNSTNSILGDVFLLCVAPSYSISPKPLYYTTLTSLNLVNGTLGM
jgi:hypothetical protein